MRTKRAQCWPSKQTNRCYNLLLSLWLRSTECRRLLSSEFESAGQSLLEQALARTAGRPIEWVRLDNSANGGNTKLVALASYRVLCFQPNRDGLVEKRGRWLEKLGFLSCTISNCNETTGVSRCKQVSASNVRRRHRRRRHRQQCSGGSRRMADVPSELGTSEVQ